MYVKKLLLISLFALFSNQIAFSERLAKTISPIILKELANIQDVTVNMLDTFLKLYEGSGWHILEYDNDPRDGEMHVVATRNMSYFMGSFSEKGVSTPHNGISVHFKKQSTMMADKVVIVFNDKEEAELFASKLTSYGIFPTSDEGETEMNYEGKIISNNGEMVYITVILDFFGRHPEAQIDIAR